jgi:cell fate regulator YaaT (PSP1 superfamily)
MDDLEYLVGYGRLGDFGRFRSGKPLGCRRGDRAVVRTHRGLEVGDVLREATPSHATFLPNTSVGQLLRLLTPADETGLARSRERAQAVFARASRLGSELGLPLEVLDAEVLFDGEHGVVHLLRWEECDVRPFVSGLAREFDLHVALADLTRTQVSHAEAEEEHAGCGREGCGGGHCSSCSSGGCKTCGAGKPEEVQAYFAGLRQKMDERRVALL